MGPLLLNCRRVQFLHPRLARTQLNETLEQRTTETKRGTSMIFVNAARQVLLFLRDDKPTIPYPGCWDLLGGAVEPNETPRDCIVRELKEEVPEVYVAIRHELRDPKLYKVTRFEDRVEYTYVQQAEIPASTPLLEGQRLQWFSADEFRALPAEQIAFGFRPLLMEFFETMNHAS